MTTVFPRIRRLASSAFCASQLTSPYPKNRTQLHHAYAHLDSLEAAREDSIAHDTYVEKMVERAHHDTLRERAAAQTALGEALGEVAEMRRAVGNERGVHAKVEQDLAELRRVVTRNEMEVETHKNELIGLRETLHSTFETLSKARNDARAAEEKVAELEHRATSAEQSAAAARAKSPVHSKTLETVQNDLAKARQEIEQARGEIATLKRVVKETEKKLSSLETETEKEKASASHRDRRSGPRSDNAAGVSRVATCAPVLDPQQEHSKALEQQSKVLDTREAALVARERDVDAREDEIARAYVALERQSLALDTAKTERGAELDAAEQAHAVRLQQQSLVAVETASRAAAQAAAQYDAVLSTRELVVARSEQKLTERSALVEGEQKRMAEMIKAAERDAAAANRQLLAVSEFAKQVNQRSTELGLTPLSPGSGRGAASALTDRDKGKAPVVPFAASPSSLPKSPFAGRKRKIDETKSPPAVKTEKRKSLGVQVMSALGFGRFVDDETDEEEETEFGPSVASGSAKSPPLSAKAKPVSAKKQKTAEKPKPGVEKKTTPLAVRRIQSSPEKPTPLALRRLQSSPKPSETRVVSPRLGRPPLSAAEKEKRATARDTKHEGAGRKKRGEKSQPVEATPRRVSVRGAPVTETPKAAAKTTQEPIQSTAEKPPPTAKRAPGRPRKTPAPDDAKTAWGEKSAVKRTASASEKKQKKTEPTPTTRRSTRASLSQA